MPVILTPVPPGLLRDNRSPEETLLAVAALVARAVPGAKGAGVTMLEQGRSQTVVSDAPLVQVVEAIQYEPRETAAAAPVRPP